jgi:hypothetical protein
MRNEVSLYTPIAVSCLVVCLLLVYGFHIEARTTGALAILVFPLMWIAAKLETVTKFGKNGTHWCDQERIVKKLLSDGVITSRQAEQIRQANETDRLSR